MKSIPIIYENSEIIVINKPYGLSVQGGENVTSSLDVVLPQQLGYKVWLVHRLDKETSGLMIVTKNAMAASKWTTLISTGMVSKEYVAVCGGIPTKKSGVLENSIQHKGRELAAVTNYKLLNSTQNTGENFSLLALKLGTGRMHQIRIHLAGAKIPILADDKHGNFTLNKIIKKEYHINKLQLASVKLTINLDGTPTVFEIPYPEHIQNAISAIGLTI